MRSPSAFARTFRAAHVPSHGVLASSSVHTFPRWPAEWSMLGMQRRRHASSMRAAIIGSGPAGFYTAARLMAVIPGCVIDMFESLPVPFGLVRFGVAPDHPEVKNCQKKFEETAASPNFNFIGNVAIGHSNGYLGGHAVELSTIMRHYNAIIFAYGAASDRDLGIPGESTLRNIFSARQFVGWYNGHPDCASLAPDFMQGEDAVIIGQGNVALDVARILLEDVNTLRTTDISELALSALATSRVKRVHIVGRRGPMQVAFTIKEARELMNLPGVFFHAVDSSLIPPDLKVLTRPRRRLMELLSTGSTSALSEVDKSWSLDFCLKPTRFLDSAESPGHVAISEFERTILSDSFSPQTKASLTGQTLTLASQLVFRSIGYKSIPLVGFAEAGVDFDATRGILKTDGFGRVVRALADKIGSKEHFPGLYCSGWLKTGPTGVIASTMTDAFETADAIAYDWIRNADRPFLGADITEQKYGWEGVRAEIQSSHMKVVTWKDWQIIDRAEKQRGQAAGKDREKFTNTADMLSVLE